MAKIEKSNETLFILITFVFNLILKLVIVTITNVINYLNVIVNSVFITNFVNEIVVFILFVVDSSDTKYSSYQWIVYMNLAGYSDYLKVRLCLFPVKQNSFEVSPNNEL